MADIEKVLDDKIEAEVSRQSKEIVTALRKEVIAAALKDLKKARPIIVKSPDFPNGKELPAPIHEMTEEVLMYLGVRMPLLLVGPAGSGKTHIATNCAELLGLDHYSISVNEQTSKSDFLGYKDANGEIVLTNFRTAYEHGGVFIIDEIDAGNPNILTVINSALSNNFCPFPDGMVKRHKDFVCVCTANTFGEGESLQYIGRNILDAATRDRFASLYINYSNTLEAILIPTYRDLLVELRDHFTKNNVMQVVSTRSGIRVELMKQVKEKLKLDDLASCLNLQQECKRDSKVVNILKKYETA